MQLNTILDKLRRYHHSIFYILTIALISFLIWVVPAPYNYIPAVLYALACFIPLVGKDGRGYLPLVLFTIITSSEIISFASVPIYLYILYASILVSIITYIIIYKCRFIKGDLLFYLVILFAIFVISYLVAAIRTGDSNNSSLLYLLLLFGCLLIYSLLSTTIGNNETLPYLQKSVVIFSLTICAQLLPFFIKNNFTIADDLFTLGWSYTRETVSTLLCLSLPFYGMLIFNKKFLYIIGEIIVISAIIILSTDSGLVTLILGIIPLLILTFRSYKRLNSYIVLASIILIGVTFALLMVFEPKFNSRIMVAIQSLNLFHESDSTRQQLFDSAASSIKSNPIIGGSIISLANDNGTVTLTKNTILSTMVLGGVFALIAFIVYEIKLYMLCLKKESQDKWLFFLMLLFVEIIGIIDNTIYNLYILIFILTVLSCYQMSNRQLDIIVHSDYYEKFDKYQEKKLD